MVIKPAAGGLWAASLAFRALLNDGRLVRVRPIVPADRGRLAGGFARLSARSRYLRFHAPVVELSEQKLDYLTDVDFREHVAWVALSLHEPGMPGVGVARFVRDRLQTGHAEFAITVLDDWQGIGLGALLLRTLLASAAERGIERLVAPVLAENEAALRLIERLGGYGARVEDDVVEMVLPVRRRFTTSARFLRPDEPASAQGG